MPRFCNEFKKKSPEKDTRFFSDFDRSADLKPILNHSITVIRWLKNRIGRIGYDVLPQFEASSGF